MFMMPELNSLCAPIHALIAIAASLLQLTKGASEVGAQAFLERLGNVQSEKLAENARRHHRIYSCPVKQ